MTVARRIARNNVVVGAGEIKIARILPDGTYDGERYMGDAVGMSVNITQTLVDVQSGSGASPTVLETIVTETDRTLTLTLHDIDAENLALFFGGVVEDVDNANAAVTDEKLSVRPARWYTLGQTPTNPLGWGALKDQVTTTITSDPSGTTYNLTTDVDYVAAAQVGAKDRTEKDVLLDLKRGAIYISPYGALKDAGPHKILVDYTPAEPESKRRRIKTGARSALGAFRYTEQSQDGANGHDVYARRCRISPNGEMALMGRDVEQRIALTCKALEPIDGYPPLVGVESMGSDSYDTTA